MKLAPVLVAVLIASATVAEASEIAFHDPAVMLCDTSASAVYVMSSGGLHPAQGFFSLYPPGATPLAPRMAVPEESEPGALLRVYVSSPEALDDASVTLTAPDGREVARATGFRAGADGSRETWALLLGVPSDVGPRSGTLAVRLRAGSRSAMLLAPFVLREKSFFSERIGLTKDLTDLIAVPDPRKTAEARALARILAHPHADAVFEPGALVVPIPGARRSAGYGDRREYEFDGRIVEVSVHQGADLAAPSGSPVPACGKGRVVFAGMRILTGNSVVIEHLPGVFSLYYHMSGIQVHVGDVVEKGQVIGKVGMTGLATGPHLHWEVRVMGVAVDPDSLTAGPLLDKEPDFRDIGGREDEGR